jgi:hypothetical protein
MNDRRLGRSFVAQPHIEAGKLVINTPILVAGKTHLQLADGLLYFGPQAPAGKEKVWIKTIPRKGWFAYFRVYGPEQAAFDGSWKPADLEEVK